MTCASGMHRACSFRLGRYGGTSSCVPNCDVSRLHAELALTSRYAWRCTWAQSASGCSASISPTRISSARRAATRWPGRSPQIDAEYAQLAAAARAQGVELVNLSPRQPPGGAAPRIRWIDSWRGPCRRRSARCNIVSYSKTPVAGVPEILARCISAKTPHRATCVWGSDDYGNGVRFAGGTCVAADSPQAARASAWQRRTWSSYTTATSIRLHRKCDREQADDHHGAQLRLERRPRAGRTRGQPGAWCLGQYQATLRRVCASGIVVPNPAAVLGALTSRDEREAPRRFASASRRPGAHERVSR